MGFSAVNAVEKRTQAVACDLFKCDSAGASGRHVAVEMRAYLRQVGVAVAPAVAVVVEAGYKEVEAAVAVEVKHNRGGECRAFQPAFASAFERAVAVVVVEIDL